MPFGERRIHKKINTLAVILYPSSFRLDGKSTSYNQGGANPPSNLGKWDWKRTSMDFESQANGERLQVC